MTKIVKTENLKFEEALKRLEQIVGNMEQDVDLEKSLVYFEEGIQLVRFCQGKLEEAKKKVEILIKKGDKMVPEKFDPEKAKNNNGDELF